MLIRKNCQVQFTIIEVTIKSLSCSGIKSNMNYLWDWNVVSSATCSSQVWRHSSLLDLPQEDHQQLSRHPATWDLQERNHSDVFSETHRWILTSKCWPAPPVNFCRTGGHVTNAGNMVGYRHSVYTENIVTHLLFKWINIIRIIQNWGLLED